MFSTKNSIYYFLFGCIPLRILIAIIPLYLDNKMLRYYAVLLSIIAGSFLYLYFANERLNAIEGGGQTWWAKYRLIHGLLYGAAAIYSLRGDRIASVPLFIDTGMGMGLFVQKRFFI
mgnify:FL=1|jgi:hypothetical protein